MKTFKYLVASLISISLIATALPANAEDAWNADLPSVPAGHSQVFIAENGVGQNSSTRFMMPRGVGSTEFAYLCPDGLTNDGGKCDRSALKDSDFGFKSGLPKCQSDTEENCVESLSLFAADGTPVDANFVRQVKGTVFNTIDEERGLYRAATESLWRATDPASNEPQDYVVSVVAMGYFDQGKSEYITEFLEASVTPYRIVYGSQYRASNLRMVTREGKESLEGWAQTLGASCAWVEDGACGKPVAMTKGLRVRLAMRVSSQLKGWFKGRIDQPTIEITKFSARNSRFVVSAGAVSVPRFSVTVDETKLASEQQMLLMQTDRTGGNGTLIKSTPPDRQGPNGKFLSLQWLDVFREISKDTAIAESTLWNFGTIRNSNKQECMDGKSGVLGIVTTNATAFTGVMPKFENKFFKYEVAGMHYAPDGKTLNEGTYDLVMQSDFARCLYGFSKAPISATISVVSDTGENKVATTLVNETKGWISLRAAGFTYSSPTISVKLTQAKPKKLTITCVKGKIIKKVSGTSPKCPAGYKKK